MFGRKTASSRDDAEPSAMVALALVRRLFLSGLRSLLLLVAASIPFSIGAAQALQDKDSPRSIKTVQERVKETKLGLASYYGPGFHGRRTASGTIFNKWEMVAAHPSYPAGTKIRVTNLKN